MKIVQMTESDVQYERSHYGNYIADGHNRSPIQYNNPLFFSIYCANRFLNLNTMWHKFDGLFDGPSMESAHLLSVIPRITVFHRSVRTVYFVVKPLLHSIY